MQFSSGRKAQVANGIIITYPVNNAGGVQVLDAAQHLVEQIGHAFVVQVHLDHLA